MALNPNPSSLRWGSGRGDGVRDQILQGDPLQAKAQRTGIDDGELEELVHQTGQSIGLDA